MGKGRASQATASCTIFAPRFMHICHASTRKKDTHGHECTIQSCSIDIVQTNGKKLLPPNGVEPVTSALLVPRSTN
jgi:hypothetical protein